MARGSAVARGLTVRKSRTVSSALAGRPRIGLRPSGATKEREQGGATKGREPSRAMPKPAGRRHPVRAAAWNAAAQTRDLSKDIGRSRITPLAFPGWHGGRRRRGKAGRGNAESGGLASSRARCGVECRCADTGSQQRQREVPDDAVGVSGATSWGATRPSCLARSKSSFPVSRDRLWLRHCG